MQKKYARLIARVGANIKKGQPVRIYASADQHEFITILVGECYKAGASKVAVDFGCQAIGKLNFKYKRRQNYGFQQETGNNGKNYNPRACQGIY